MPDLTEDMAMTFGSLFAGIGGFDLGFERTGMQCVWQVERDRQCLELLTQKWPNVRRVNDVIRARYATESKYAGRMDTAALVRPDIICGGFPCQDLSVAGKRRGLAGGRSGLFWIMRRIIGILKPAWFVLENVPGLLSSNAGRDMGAVIGSLVDSGYGVAWRVLDSQFFGLAQRRKRVFIVGHLGDVRRAGAVLFDGESVRRDTPPSREARETVAGTLESRTNGGGFPGSDGAMSGHVVASAFMASDYKTGQFEDAETSRPITGSADRSRVAPIVAFTQNTRDEVREIGGNIAGALPAQPGMKQQTYVAIDYANGTFAESDHAMPLTRSLDRSRATPVVAMTLNAKNGKRYDAESETLLPRFARNGRGGPSEAVDALTASESGTHGDSKPHVATRQGVRRLMPIECERLQGFPDNWTAGFSDSARYRMLGNAVSVPVIEWIAKRIKDNQ